MTTSERPVSNGAGHASIEDFRTALTIVYAALHTLERPPNELTETQRHEVLTVALEAAERIVRSVDAVAIEGAGERGR